MAYFRIKKGDLLPYLAIEVVDSNGDAYDLSTCTVKFIMSKYPSGTTKVNTSANITSATEGYVEYRWSSGDTDTVGKYHAEFQIKTGSNVPFTVPVYDKLNVEVVQDLGD